MSFDLLKRARRNVGVRLGLWYAFVFAVQQRRVADARLLSAGGGDRPQGPEVLEARLQEYAAVYDD